jgi:hypothetical protein
MKVGSLEIELLANMARLSKDMREAERVTQSAMAGIEKAVGLAKAALGALGISLSAAFAASWLKGIVEGLNALKELRDATGSSIEKLSALEDVALRTGGSFETIGQALTKFNKALIDAKADSQVALTLKQIGLSAKELRELDPSDALFKTAKALAQFADDGNKARIVQELFGKSLREVAPFLNNLSQAQELNAKVTTEQALEAEKFINQLASLKKNSEDAARALVGDLLPALNAVLAAFGKKGLKGALDQLGNQLFDWEGNALRKELRNLEADLKNALNAPATVRRMLNIDVDQMAADIAKLRASYFNLNSTAGAGRGSVNPALVEMRASAGPGRDASLIKQQEDAYRALLKPIDERIALAAAETRAGRELNDIEKASIKLEVDLKDAKVQLSPAQKQAVRDKLAEAQAKELVNQMSRQELALAKQIAQQVFQDAADMAAFDKSRADSRDRLLAQKREEALNLADESEQLRTEIQLLGTVDSERTYGLELLRIEQKLKRELQKIDEDLRLSPEARALAKQRETDNANTARSNASLRKDLQEQIELWGKLDDIGRQFWSDMLLDGNHALDNLGRSLKKLLVDEFAKLAQQEFKILITPQVGSGTGGSLLKTLGGGIEKIFGLAEGSVAKFVSSAVPILGGVLAVGQMLGLFKHGGPKTESGFGAGVALRGDPTQASGVAQSIQQQYATIAAAVGVKDAIKDLGVFFAADPQGTAQTQLEIRGGSYARSAMYGGNIENVGRSDAELQSAIALASAQLIVKNLQDAASGKVGDFLKSFDVTSASLEQLTGALTVAKQVGEFDHAVTALGGPFKTLVNLSIESAQALSQLTGAMVSFINDFATDAEKSQYLAEQISSQLSTGGLATSVQQVLDMSRDQYKAAVLAAVAAGDAGAKTLAALLSVEQAFNQLHPVLQQAAVDVTNLADMQAQLLADSSNALMDAYHREADALQGVIDKNRSYVAALKQLQQSLTTGPLALLSPQAQYDKTREDFMRLAALPANSDERLANLPAVSEAFLQASQAYNASSVQYFRDLDQVLAATQASKTAAEANVDVAQLQLNAMTNQLSALGLIDTHLVSFQQALATYLGVKSGAGSVAGSGGAGAGSFDSSGGYNAGGGVTLTADRVAQIHGTFSGLNALEMAYLGQYGQAISSSDFGALPDEVRDWSSSQIADWVATHAPGHASGLDYVPYDNYLMYAHKGEAVLSAGDAGNWRGAADGEMAAVRDSVDNLTAVVASYAKRDLNATGRIARSADKNSSYVRVLYSRVPRKANDVATI